MCNVYVSNTHSLTFGSITNMYPIQVIQFSGIILCILFVFVSNAASENVKINNEFCTIQIESGRVRGKQNQTLLENKLFYSFRGIPFAKPPINDLRFKVKKKYIILIMFHEIVNFILISIERHHKKTIHGMEHGMHSNLEMTVAKE